MERSCSVRRTFCSSCSSATASATDCKNPLRVAETSSARCFSAALSTPLNYCVGGALSIISGGDFFLSGITDRPVERLPHDLSAWVLITVIVRCQQALHSARSRLSQLPDGGKVDRDLLSCFLTLAFPHSVSLIVRSELRHDLRQWVRQRVSFQVRYLRVGDTGLPAALSVEATPFVQVVHRPGRSAPELLGKHPRLPQLCQRVMHDIVLWSRLRHRSHFGRNARPIPFSWRVDQPCIAADPSQVLAWWR